MLQVIIREEFISVANTSILDMFFLKRKCERCGRIERNVRSKVLEPAHGKEKVCAVCRKFDEDFKARVENRRRLKELEEQKQGKKKEKENI